MYIKYKKIQILEFWLPAIIWSFTRITVRGTSLSLLVFLFLFLLLGFFFLLATLRRFRPRKFVRSYSKSFTINKFNFFFFLLIIFNFFNSCSGRLPVDKCIPCADNKESCSTMYPCVKQILYSNDTSYLLYSIKK